MNHLKNSISLFIALLLTLSVYGTDEEKGSEFARETATIWRNQKAYALALIEQMPEEKLEFAPVDSIRSFSRLFKHIGAVELILETVFSQQEMPPIFPKLGEMEAQPMTKTELKKFVSDRYDGAIAKFENMTDKQLEQTYTFSFFPGDPPVKTYREIITAIGAHIVHHRGQATIYLRMNGIKPAPYTHYW